MPFQHTAIIGLGLLGGSLAFDLRRRFPDMAITGIARRQATLEEAAALRVDAAPLFTGLSCDPSVIRNADLVVLCTPVNTIVQQLADLAPLFAPGTIVTDVGSTKRMIMNAAALVLPAEVHFIGGHPMAGSERMGLSHARTDLYRGATWAMCIPEGKDASADRLADVVRIIGASPLPIDPDLHDTLVALSSHLPHVVAGALTNIVLGEGESVKPFIAGGFRDTTRIAAADPVMWRDIFLTNKDCVLDAFDTLIAELMAWRGAIASGDAPHLEALLDMARQRRKGLL